MILDKDGRVFGKINIIDLLAILLLIALVAIFGTKFLLPRTGEIKAELQFWVPEAENWLAERITTAAPLYDQENGSHLGYVTHLETDVPSTWTVSADGKFSPASREGFCSLKIYGNTVAVEEENGVTISGNHYAVGQTVLLCAGDTQLSARVRDIRIQPPQKQAENGKK